MFSVANVVNYVSFGDTAVFPGRWNVVDIDAFFLGYVAHSRGRK